jgi:phosphoribosyl 1,2-cyclic phosphodiesterase
LRRAHECDIFLSHCHLDHITGVPFFAPFFVDGFHIRIWAGNLLPQGSVEHVMRKVIGSPLFPVQVEIFKAEIEFHDFSSGEILRLYDDVILRPRHSIIRTGPAATVWSMADAYLL